MSSGESFVSALEEDVMEQLRLEPTERRRPTSSVRGRNYVLNFPVTTSPVVRSSLGMGHQVRQPPRSPLVQRTAMSKPSSTTGTSTASHVRPPGTTVRQPRSPVVRPSAMSKQSQPATVTSTTSLVRPQGNTVRPPRVTRCPTTVTYTAPVVRSSVFTVRHSGERRGLSAPVTTMAPVVHPSTSTGRYSQTRTSSVRPTATYTRAPAPVYYRDLEAIRPMENPFGPILYETHDPNRVPVELNVCWRCGTPGHTRERCEKGALLFCSRCGIIGIKSRDCPCGQFRAVRPTNPLPNTGGQQKKKRPRQRTNIPRRRGPDSTSETRGRCPHCRR